MDPKTKTSILAVTSLVCLTLALLRAKRKKKKKVVMTGGCGNLATKLAAHLQNDWEVVGIEHPDFIQERPYTIIESDLLDTSPGAPWRQALKGADAVVHFSAVNPYPNATWREAELSMSHTFNVFLQAKALRIPRILLASSNHVCGGYKDDPSHGIIKPSHPPRCGTFLLDEKNLAKSGNAVAYASAKLAGERLALALSDATSCFLVLRIGWCQPGQNLPTTISAAGVPEIFQTKTDTKVVDTASDDTWFKNMWLSNSDFLAFFASALSIPLPFASSKTPYFALVNAMSKNSGARWSLTETTQLLGVSPQSDAASYGSA